MGLFDLFKKKSVEESEVIQTETTLQRDAAPLMNTREQEKSLADLFNDDLKMIIEILKAHGCDIVSDASEIKMAYDTSWFSEYRIIKTDGIYLYREVNMGGYNLEKRLDCLDVSVSFVILCADMLLGMKYRKMICDSDADYQKILEIMVNYKSKTHSCISNSDKEHFLVVSYNDLIQMDANCKINEHYFVDLVHYTHGSECHCKKCGLVERFNRGWPERIDPKEMDDFLEKYKGSTFDF